jgi:ABC-type phosphate/phosphonate transport system permease subunit
MINKIVEALDPVVVGTILGILLLFPFAFFIYDSEKNPDKYNHK